MKSFIKQKLILLLGVSVSLIFNSCSDIDEVSDNSEFNGPPLPPFVDSGDLQVGGVLGAYGVLATVTDFNDYTAFAFSGDDLTTTAGSNKGEFVQYDSRRISPNNSRTTDRWNNLYILIDRINNTFDRSSDLDPNASEDISVAFGELFFLRGFAYHELIKVHNRVPLQLTSPPNPVIGLATRVEVLEQIESDYKMAEKMLPVIFDPTFTLSGAARPNKGTAKSFLARLYLEWAGFPLNDTSKYAMAREMAKDVIDNKNEHGFGLVSDINSLWSLADKFNTEGVFTITYSLNTEQNKKFDQLGVPEGAPYGGWGETFSEIKFFEDFPEGARKEATFITDIRDLNRALDITTDDGAVERWEDLPQPKPIYRKITGDLDEFTNNFLTLRNDYAMRYAEVLLIFAEASGRSGNVTAEAWAALNEVRVRAGLDELSASDGDIEELAFTERKWEFAAENLRWTDLVRMDRVEEVLSKSRDITNTFNSNGDLLTEAVEISPRADLSDRSAYFSVIPGSIVQANPNLRE